MFKFLKKQKFKYKCPCCGYYTFTSKPKGEYDICPVCYWEDDPFQAENPDLGNMANTVSLNQARENYKKFSACQEDCIKYVRLPKKDELIGLDD
ncbi:MAG: CPCC family cysteine-rich protein [Candidatus Coproplasma sp.]